MKKCLLIFFGFACIFSEAIAQNYKTQLAELTAKKDTAAQTRLLAEWENNRPQDPDLYIAYFNHYITKSKYEVLNLTTQQTGDKSLQLTDPKTGKVAGFLNSGGISYKKEVLDKAFYYVDLGINKFPQRLDMRFGKIYMLGQVNNYDAFTREIIKTVDFGAKINLKWTWTDDKALEDAKNFMLGNVQNYVGQLYNAGDEQLNNMRAVAETVLKYYPDHVESLSNYAITYLLKNDFDKALTPLLKAATIAPTDGVVLGNIAYCYNAKGDKPNAIKYYELTQKYGDEQAKTFAAKKLQELKK